MKKLLLIVAALTLPHVASAQSPSSQSFDFTSGLVPNNVFIFAIGAPSVSRVDVLSLPTIEGTSQSGIPFDFFLNNQLVVAGLLFAPDFTSHIFGTGYLTRVDPPLFGGGGYVLRVQPSGAGTPGAGTVTLHLQGDLIGVLAPEPASLLLLATGLAGIGGMARRRRAA